MKLLDGRSDKYALIGTGAVAIVSLLCAYIPGGLALAPIVIPAVAGLWGAVALKPSSWRADCTPAQPATPPAITTPQEPDK